MTHFEGAPETESVPDPKKEAARNALREVDGELQEKILKHPKLVDTLAWVDSQGRTPSPGFSGDLRAIDPSLSDEYLVGLAKKEGLPNTRVDRIVGSANPEVAMARHRFEVLKNREAKFENEREATPEEKTMIERAIKNIDKLREKHGLPPAGLSLERVKMLENEVIKVKRSDRSVEMDFAGMDIPTFQVEVVAVKERRGAAKFDMIQHELLHGGSYQSLQRHEGEELLNYRGGISVSSRKKDENGELGSFMTPLNEAVTEENARRFTLAIREDDPEVGFVATARKKAFEDFSAIYQEKNLNKPKPQEDELLEAKINYENQQISVTTSGYPAERQAMWRLFDKIHEKNPDAFSGKSPEEARETMFDMVTKAALDGNILPFGRLMNDTFGRGTFRKYGHLQTAQEIVALIDLLDTVKKETEAKPADEEKK